MEIINKILMINVLALCIIITHKYDISVDYENLAYLFLPRSSRMKM